MNVVGCEQFFYERVCYEVVLCERELLWTSLLGSGLLWT